MTVYKRDGSPYWYFDVTVSGRRKRVSTKRTVKKEAVEVADRYRRDMLDRTQLGGVPTITLREALFDHYLPSKRKAAGYRNIEHNCRKIVGEVAGIKGLPASLPFHELTTSMLRTYRHQREEQDASAQTIDHEIKVVSAAYHLVSSDFLVRPGLKFPLERPKGKPRFLLAEEEEALLQELDPARPLTPRGRSSYLVTVSAQQYRQRVDNYDLVIMLLDTGCRFGEIAGLTWAMVDTLDWDWVHIYRPKVDNQSRLSMTRRMKAVLQRRYAERGKSHFVFPGWSSEKDVPKGSTAAIRRAMDRVGINSPENVARFGRRDVRSLRDTFATKIRMKGMPLDRIQKLLGHASSAMTQKYADLVVDTASKEAVEILDQTRGD